MVDSAQGVSNLTTSASLVHRTDVNLRVFILFSESRHLRLNFVVGVSTDNDDIELSREIPQDAFDSRDEVVALMVDDGEDDSNVLQVVVAG